MISLVSLLANFSASSHKQTIFQTVELKRRKHTYWKLKIKLPTGRFWRLLPPNRIERNFQQMEKRLSIPAIMRKRLGFPVSPDAERTTSKSLAYNAPGDINEIKTKAPFYWPVTCL